MRLSLSRSFGGRVSDKVITQKSGILDLLQYGDQVLADRSFLIDEELASRGASPLSTAHLFLFVSPIFFSASVLDLESRKKKNFL